MNEFYKNPIGTRFFMKRGKRNDVCTVVDVIVTKSELTGETIKKEVVAEHEFCGQVVKEYLPLATVALAEKV